MLCCSSAAACLLVCLCVVMVVVKEGSEGRRDVGRLGEKELSSSRPQMTKGSAKIARRGHFCGTVCMRRCCWGLCGLLLCSAAVYSMVARKAL